MKKQHSTEKLKDFNRAYYKHWKDLAIINKIEKEKARHRIWHKIETAKAEKEKARRNK